MPFVPITVQPGVVKTESPDAARGRWIDMDKIRFVRGLPEKVGGVRKWVEEPTEEPARAAQAFGSYTNVQVLAFGTASHFYLFREGALSDITPYRADAIAISLTNPFQTTSGSPIVRVTDNNHGITAAGVTVTFDGASAVGGITIDGDYEVTQVIDVNTFTVTHTSNASSSTTGGGTVTASYGINPGHVDTDYLVGWGVSTWGDGGWGQDASLASALISDPTNWSIGIYGEDLIINRSEESIWFYDTSNGISRPTLLANSPDRVRYAFVTPERYIFALGCTTLGSLFDPMTVRWPDIEDPTAWTPLETNTANERKLQGGTRLIAGGALTDGLSLVWSDTSVFLFQFTGSSAIYSSRMVSTDCGLVGPHAFTTANGAAFWMSELNFWMFNGYAQPVPNVEDIRRWVFSRINPVAVMKSFAFFNSVFNEVWFCFPTGGYTEPNEYVMVDLDNFAWCHGTLARTAATIYSVRESRPILFGGTTDGDYFAWMHEFDDYADNDDVAMPVHIELSPTDIDDGNRSLDIFGFVPDMQRQTGDFTLTLTAKDHPRGDDMMVDVLAISPTDKLVDARCGGRQFSMKLEFAAQGCDFRMGRWGLEIQGAGTKRGSQ